MGAGDECICISMGACVTDTLGGVCMTEFSVSSEISAYGSGECGEEV